MKFWVTILVAGLSLACCAQDTGRYDVRHYDTDNGLPQNSIKGMKMDARGYLWLLTEGGLVRFDGQRFSLYDKLPDGSKLTQRLSALHLAGRDTVLIVAAGGTAYRATALEELAVFKPDPVVWEDQRLMMGITAASINGRCYNMVKNRLQPAWILPYFQLNDMGAGKGLARLGDQYYWFNAGNELVCADTLLQQFRRIPMLHFPPLSDVARQVRVITHQGTIAIQWGEHLCLTRFAGDDLVAEEIVYTGHVGAITQVEQTPVDKILFVGTLTNGFYQFTPQAFTTKVFKGNGPNVFYAQAPFGDHDVLTHKGVVTGDNGPQLDSFRPFTVLSTRAGQYVLSKWGHPLVNGLSFFNSSLRRVDFLPLPEPAIGYMYELSDSSICIAALGNRFGRLRNRQIEWLNTIDSLKRFQVTVVREIAPGLLWIAGPQGLARFDLRTRRFDRVKGLEGLGARSLYLDSSGILWIGTYGNGFYACVNDRLVKMPLDRNEYLRHVHAFLVDSKGFCWMSTNRGLFQARLSAMQAYMLQRASAVYYHYYDKSSGFLTNEFNGGGNPPAVMTRSGLFSFPSMNGIVQFDPLAVEPVLSHNGIYVDQVWADSQLLQPAGGRYLMPAGVQRIALVVSSPFWGTPENHRIEYRLNAVDSAWHLLPAGGVAAFERLPGGRYEILFRMKYGFDGEQVLLKQGFVVAVALYERWWFYCLLAVGALLILWLLFRLRFRYMMQRQKRLESEVAFRTKEQGRLIDELRSTVAELETSQAELSRHARLLEMVSMTISHDLQSPLRFFSDVSASVHDQSKLLGHPSLEGLSRELLSASRNIHSFVKEFGYWVKSLQNRVIVHREPIELDRLLEELSAFSREVVKQRGNVLTIAGATGVVVASDRQLLQIILRNLIDNANKHTKNGGIVLCVTTNEQYASISVSDTGRGFQADRLTLIREILRGPFDGAGAVKESRGFGYYFISDFSRLLNIAVRIENQPLMGAVIHLENLPVVRGYISAAGKTIDHDTRSTS